MLKRTIKYKDFNDVEREETFAFNLTKLEVVKLEASVPGGFGEHLQSLEGSTDGKAIIAALERLFRAAYGEINAENKFLKTPELFESFSTTEAYSELFMKIATDPKEFASFVQGVMPKDLVEEAKRIEALGNATDFSGWDKIEKPHVLSREEASTMDPEELRRGLVSGKYALEIPQ